MDVRMADTSYVGDHLEEITITKKFKKIIFSCHFVSIMIEPSYLTPKLFQLTCFEGCQGIYPHRHRRLGGTFSRQTAQWAVCLDTPR